eukprot:gene10453-8408_t
MNSRVGLGPSTSSSIGEGNMRVAARKVWGHVRTPRLPGPLAWTCPPPARSSSVVYAKFPTGPGGDSQKRRGPRPQPPPPRSPTGSSREGRAPRPSPGVQNPPPNNPSRSASSRSPQPSSSGYRKQASSPSNPKARQQAPASNSSGRRLHQNGDPPSHGQNHKPLRQPTAGPISNVDELLAAAVSAPMASVNDAVYVVPALNADINQLYTFLSILATRRGQVLKDRSGNNAQLHDLINALAADGMACLPSMGVEEAPRFIFSMGRLGYSVPVDIEETSKMLHSK